MDKFCPFHGPKEETTPVAAASSEERTFRAGYDVSQFERPSVAVDMVLLALSGGCLHTLLVLRSEHPCKGQWALPGGFVEMAESLEKAAARVLRDKAGLRRRH